MCEPSEFGYPDGTFVDCSDNGFVPVSEAGTDDFSEFVTGYEIL